MRENSKKGLATRTIVLLVMAIIVFAIIMLLVYQSFISSSVFSLESCKNLVKDECNRCMFASLDTQCKLISSGAVCSNALTSIGISINPDGSFDKSECIKLGFG